MSCNANAVWPETRGSVLELRRFRYDDDYAAVGEYTLLHLYMGGRCVLPESTGEPECDRKDWCTPPCGRHGSDTTRFVQFEPPDLLYILEVQGHRSVLFQ